MSFPSVLSTSKFLSKYSPPTGSRIMFTPPGAHSFIFEKISFDLISPSDAPRFRQNLIFSSVPAVTKLSQSNTFAS